MTTDDLVDLLYRIAKQFVKMVEQKRRELAQAKQ